MKKRSNPRERSPGAEQHAATARPVYSSSELFVETRLVIIEHAGEEYRLRITSKDKLILTK